MCFLAWITLQLVRRRCIWNWMMHALPDCYNCVLSSPLPSPSVIIIILISALFITIWIVDPFIARRANLCAPCANLLQRLQPRIPAAPSNPAPTTSANWKGAALLAVYLICRSSFLILASPSYFNSLQKQSCVAPVFLPIRLWGITHPNPINIFFLKSLHSFSYSFSPQFLIHLVTC